MEHIIQPVSFEPGIVYLLTNVAMPGLVKIGKTKRNDTQYRMKELFTSGVPFPFDCVYAAKVSDVDKVERALHTAFAPNRINEKREFFKIEANQAIAIIKLLEIENATPQVAREAHNVDPISSEAAKQLVKRRPRLNFIEMQIPIGSELISKSSSEVAIVVSDREVQFRGEKMSLTRATRMVFENDYNIAPGPYWSYNGKLISNIYDDTYSFEY